MVNTAVPLKTTTSISITVQTLVSTTIPISGKTTNLAGETQKYLGVAQKQIFGFFSGIYDLVSDNPAESSLSVLLLLGMFYIYY